MRKICLLLLLVAMSSAVYAGNDWKLKKDKNGIKIYLRKVPGSPLKEFMGVVYFKNTRLSSLVAVLDDTSSYPRWMHKCIEARLLKQVSLYNRLSYTVTDAPWPVSDRDLVAYSEITQDAKTGAVIIRISARPDYLPANKKRVRVPRMKGSWTFVPAGQGTIKVVYRMHSDPGGSLPAGLANMAVVDLPFRTLTELRKIVKEGKYANARYELVKEPDNR
jgi:hypothetical protein